MYEDIRTGWFYDDGYGMIFKIIDFESDPNDESKFTVTYQVLGGELKTFEMDGDDLEFRFDLCWVELNSKQIDNFVAEYEDLKANAAKSI